MIHLHPWCTGSQYVILTATVSFITDDRRTVIVPVHVQSELSGAPGAAGPTADEVCSVEMGR